MKKLLLLLPLVAAALVAFFLLRDRIPEFVEWVRGRGVLGALLIGLVYVAAVALLVPASALTLAIGFIYGPVVGTAIVSPASVVGATVAFLLARTLLRKPVEQKFGASPRFKALDRAIEKDGLKILILTRLSPVIPFGPLNYLFGLTRMPLLPYVLGSFVGMLPGTFLYVYLGSTLEDVSQIVSGGASAGGAGTVLKWAGLAATVVVTVYITLIARKAFREAAPEVATEAADANQ
ncbi:MAG: TVP38/TMEM64 family protein [Planctomycetota bacterium]|nr:MAG: TVP38/TMEM64 family protein [Planctomycetota bacterium]